MVIRRDTLAETSCLKSRHLPTTDDGWIVDPNGPSASRQAQLRRVGEATLRQQDRMPWGQRAAAIQGWIDQQTQDPGTDAEEEVEPDGRFATAGVRSAPNHDVAALNRRWFGSYGAAIDDDNATTDTDEHETIIRDAQSLASTLQDEGNRHPLARGNEWDSPLWAEWNLAGQGRAATPPAVHHEDESGDGAGPHYSDVSHASDTGGEVGPQRDDGGSDSGSLMSLGFAPQANQQWAPANPSGSDDVPPPLVAAHAITVFLRDRAYRLGVRRLEVHDGTCFRKKI
ncbi:uncharacterized protein LOC117189860 [Drosophila miranda]|uniref:uncharacterized protein LOC117189860 n=1 Tax=Drosophila miranda TaxID=7229 RepID=UPI00143F904C|nr:uncharacterized protein LOC117189860 [Drosophila miranda]